MTELKCNSCKKKVANLKGTVSFPCPECGKGRMWLLDGGKGVGKEVVPFDIPTL